MKDDHIDSILRLADRLVALAEKRWGTPEEAPHAEVFKRGDPPPKAETREAYQALPEEGDGRFAAFVRAGAKK